MTACRDKRRRPTRLRCYSIVHLNLSVLRTTPHGTAARYIKLNTFKCLVSTLRVSNLSLGFLAFLLSLNTKELPETFLSPVKTETDGVSSKDRHKQSGFPPRDGPR
jgi:hypothetical protein